MGGSRPGSKTLGTVLKTDELDGHDGLRLGPWRDAATGRILAESDFFEPLTVNSLIVASYGSRMYFPTDEGFTTLRVKPATGWPPVLRLGKGGP